MSLTSKPVSARAPGFAGRGQRGLALIVELVAALSILLLGFVALMRLLRSSGEDGAQAGQETAAAWFADAVMNGLRAEATEAAAGGRWIEFWAGLQSGSDTLSVAAQDMWAEPLTSLVVRADDTPAQVAFRIRHQHADENDTPFTDHALWYRLRAQTDARSSAATLRIWPGEAVAVTNREPVRVHTTIWNPEGL